MTDPNETAEPSAASAGSVNVGETNMDDDDRIALEQEIADLRFALRQATDRASLAEVKCSQLLESGRLTAAEREAVATAIDCVRDRLEGFDDCEAVQVTLRGLLERLK